jgi:hypothetical protein
MTDDETAPERPGLTGIGAAATGGSATLSGPAPLTATGRAVSGGTASLSVGVGLTATGHAVSGGSATLTRYEFRDLSVAAARAAFARLEAKASAGADARGIFGELTEVLGWLYALGDIGKKRNQMHAGLRWARTMHGHGLLLTEASYVAPKGGYAAADYASTPYGGTQEHRWLSRDKIRRRREAAHLEADYDADIADHPVLSTLRGELNRLAALTGSPA